MELTRLRNTIVSLLHNYTQRPVVMINQISDKPLKSDKSSIDYPFIAYKITSNFIKDKEMGVHTQKVVDSTNPNFTEDILQTLTFQAQANISFTCYAKDSMQAKELAQKVWDYFKYIGYQDLSNNNIVIIECMNIQNRDVFEVDFYERREGFDVRIRYVHKIERRLETIQTHKINEV